MTISNILPPTRTLFDHRQDLPPPKHMMRKAIWGSKQITLASKDGQVWEGPSGIDGLILVLRAANGKWIAAVEDRATGNRWSGEAKRNDGAALANLRREIGRFREVSR